MGVRQGYVNSRLKFIKLLYFFYFGFYLFLFPVSGCTDLIKVKVNLLYNNVKPPQSLFSAPSCPFYSGRLFQSYKYPNRDNLFVKYI